MYMLQIYFPEAEPLVARPPVLAKPLRKEAEGSGEAAPDKFRPTHLGDLKSSFLATWSASKTA